VRAVARDTAAASRALPCIGGGRAWRRGADDGDLDGLDLRAACSCCWQWIVG